MDVCAKCRKTGVGFKRCSVCKQNTYCGAACQAADWKSHKKKCASPVSVADIGTRIDAALAEQDWKGILKWEGRMEEMMAACAESDNVCILILSRFSNAHLQLFKATGNKDHARSCAGLVERQIPLLGRLGRFRDQGEDMCKLADILVSLCENRGNLARAATLRQQARDIGAEHGLFSLESMACRGLGKTAMLEGPDSTEDGLALLRNGLVAAELNELDDPQYVMDALYDLIMALFAEDSFAEAEPLVMRFREAQKASTAEDGRFCILEFTSVVWCARIHEVIALYSPSLLTPKRYRHNNTQ